MGKTILQEKMLDYAQKLLLQDAKKLNRMLCYENIILFRGEEYPNFIFAPSYRCALAFQRYNKDKNKESEYKYKGRLKLSQPIKKRFPWQI